jgi:hypothetical protein
MTSTQLQQFRAAMQGVAALSTEVQVIREVSEADLLELTQLAAELSRSVGTQTALLAGEIARRSAPALGSAGLAQRTGHRTPEQLLKLASGMSGRDAARAIRLGRLMHNSALAGTADPATGEIVENGQPWLRPIADAVHSAMISVDAADAIRVGLGTPNSAVNTTQLRTAAAQLCEEATSVDPDQLAHRARQLRDELDAAGIPIREAERRSERSFRITVLPNGMGRAVWVMDPETLASVKDVYDRATSPKLGGVRFTSPEGAQRVKQIMADTRTPVQLASDAMEQLIRLGAGTNPQFLLGSGAPMVKVIVTKVAFDERAGHGRLEGHTDAISIQNVERQRCAGGTVGITFDHDGQPLDVGREQRLFTKRQRLALAVRDGGCMAPGCDRPPSWCESHHIEYWARDHGHTNTGNGILLCKHHHLLIHNNKWHINRDDQHRYWLIPPPNVDPDQTPRPMPSKSAAMRDLRLVSRGDSLAGEAH